MCNADVCVGIRMRETGQVHPVSRYFGLLGFSGFTIGTLHIIGSSIRRKAYLPELPPPATTRLRRQ